MNFRERLFIPVLLVFVLFVGVSTVNAGEDENLIPEVEYSHFTLDNGLEIYVFEDHQVPLAEVSLWYNVGSIDEPAGLTGISHFVEHATFLGTETLEEGEIPELVKSVGGSNNASTDYWRTRYYETVPASSLELAVALEADRMQNMMLLHEEFEREKEVILQERRRRIENDAYESGLVKIKEEAFKDTPLEHHVVGWREDLRNINLIDLYKYYKKYYVPNNAILSVAGDVDPEEVYELAQKYFADYERGEIPERDFTFPEQEEERVVRVREVTEVPYVIMLYKLPPGDHPDVVAVDFLLDILVNRSTSRVNEELRQKQQILLGAWGMNAQLPVPGYSQVVLVPNSEQSVEKAVRGYEEELGKIVENGVSREEIKAVKRDLTKSLILSQRNIVDFSSEVISSHLKYGEPEFYQTRIERLEEITEEDIIRVARKYFKQEKRTTGYILPKKEENNLMDNMLR